MVGEYKALDVSNFSCQSKDQRYPSNDDNGNSNGRHQGRPRVAEWRSNLIALSQKVNLYFACYGDDLHVTIPQGLKQTIPTTPELVLRLPRSQAGRIVGGYISAGRPHSANNILVGNYGSHEILLVACDDGDIIGYYVHLIHACVNVRGATVKPFFHENVGASAWGLAIHENSRLIAASCNLRQVTVFMAAYTPFEELDPDARPIVNQMLFPPVAYLPGMRSEERTKSGGRRMFDLGDRGHNIPSLSFADDQHGEAHSIAAVDIGGTLWMFSLFDDDHQLFPGLETGNMGWGVLAIPLQAFKRTKTPYEAIGGGRCLRAALTVSVLHNDVTKIFNLSSSVSSLTERYFLQPLIAVRSHLSPLQAEPDDSDDEGQTEMEVEPMFKSLLELLSDTREADKKALEGHLLDYPGTAALENAGIRRSADGHLVPTLSYHHRHGEEEFHTMVNLHPDQLGGVTTMEKLHDYIDGRPPLKFDPNNRHMHSTPNLPSYCAILRTYAHDIELLAPTVASPRTLFRRPFHMAEVHRMPHLLRPFQRLNLIVFIPALSLVIVGSQAGRVALLTLTRPEDAFSVNGPIVSLRLDDILPTNRQQREHLRPQRALLGIAASPLQVPGEVPTRDARRWRLIMQYYDHTVLSYELSRDENTDLLMVL